MTRAITETRAAGEKGVQLIEGVHTGLRGDCVITIQQANGIIREIPYRDEDRATPVLIAAMILDKGIECPEIEEAATGYCLSFIKKINDITIGTLSCYVEAFEEGYKAALK